MDDFGSARSGRPELRGRSKVDGRPCGQDGSQAKGRSRGRSAPLPGNSHAARRRFARSGRAPGRCAPGPRRFARRFQSLAARESLGRRGLHEVLSLHVSRAGSLPGHCAARSEGLAVSDVGASIVHGSRRTAEVFPCLSLRDRRVDGLRIGRRERSGPGNPRRSPRPHDGRAPGLRGGARDSLLLVTDGGSFDSENRRARGDFALRGIRRPAALFHHDRTQSLADLGGHRLVQHSRAHSRSPGPRRENAGGGADPSLPPEFSGHDHGLLDGAARLPVVAPGLDGRQRGPRASFAHGLPGMARGHPARGARGIGPPAPGPLGHERGQCVGCAGHGEILHGVREGAGVRHRHSEYRRTLSEP